EEGSYMGLKLASPPPGGMEVVGDALARLAELRPAPAADLAGSGPVAERRLVPPQEVYQVPLDAVTGRAPLKSAEAVAWRYLVVEGDRPIEAAETTLGGETGVRFAHINRGAFVEGF